MRPLWTRMMQRPSLLLVALLSIALGFSLAANLHRLPSSPVVAAPATPRTPGDWRDGFTSIADALAPSVVNITSEKTVAVTDPFSGMEDFFNFGPFRSPSPQPAPKREEQQKATGSGVIVRSDGYILTNNHVVAGADRVTVKLVDGREFKGKVVTDPRTDLALVKIDANGLPAAQFADSDKVKVGQWAIAMGNPFGLRNTMTAGIVSAVRREADPDTPTGYPETIQTDAPINPGNSGGPLVDIDGKIIGINFMILSGSGGNMGIGFAIPSNTAKFVVDQLIDKGKVVRGYLGLIPQDLSPVLADKLKVKEGALVESVDKDSPAAKGGVEVKDVIVKLDGKPITNALSLRRTVERIAPGTDVKVVVVREGKEKTVTVKLGEAPSGDETEPATPESGDSTGLTVRPLTAELAKQLGVGTDVQGVVVTAVKAGSPGDRAGIQPKDIIVEIDNNPVTSVATFSKAAKQLKKGETAIVVVQRGNRTTILEMPMD